MVAALAAAVVAVARSWPEVQEALERTEPWVLVAAGLVAPVYLVATMFAWRAVLGDLGSRLSLWDSFAVFFVSQLGKYLPGSLWNVVAAAELGADRRVPRRRSLTAMGVTLLMALAAGSALGVVGLLLAPSQAQERFGLAAWVAPVFVVLALPPVTNRLATVALRVLRRPPLEHALTVAGAAIGFGWTLVGWLLAGLHVWLLAIATGMAPTLGSYLVCTGGYALAWIVGFLAIPVPAGLGVREVILVAVLSQSLDAGSVIVVVLLSRVLLTAADLALAGYASVVGSRHWRRSGGPVPS